MEAAIERRAISEAITHLEKHLADAGAPQTARARQLLADSRTSISERAATVIVSKAFDSISRDKLIAVVRQRRPLPLDMTVLSHPALFDTMLSAETGGNEVPLPGIEMFAADPALRFRESGTPAPFEIATSESS